MRRPPLPLIFSILLAATASAAEPAAVPASSVTAEANDTWPAPELVRLDQALGKAQAAREQGRLDPERYADFLIRIRAKLERAKADAAPSPINEALYARIRARLGEFDGAVVRAAWAPASADARSALSRTRFREKTAPAVIAAEKAVLASEPFNDDRSAQSVVEAGGAAQRSRSAFGEASRRAAANLLANLPTPPSPSNDGRASTTSEAAGLAATAALGAAGAMLLFGGWGGDEIEKRLPGTKARMGMAAALGGVVATAGFLMIPAAPLLAQEQPQITGSVEEMEPYVVDEGKIVNRVWHSDWQAVKGSSGPRGASFCDGACMPIHAQSAIERRGLDIPGLINDAQHGGLFEAVGNIPAQIRTSIDGVEGEIVIESRYWHLLKFIPESHSQLPPGPK